MGWEVVFHDAFVHEFRAMDAEQKVALLAAVTALKAVGPGAQRPLVGVLKSDKHANLKELRYHAHGKSQVWRAAFAFDPLRRAIILAAGAKQGKDEGRFYRSLLAKATKRLDDHLKELCPRDEGIESPTQAAGRSRK